MTVRMNPEIKVAWVAWLRANVENQGTGLLRNGDNEYCCLGGLCELAVAAGIVRAYRRTTSYHSPGAMSYISLTDPTDRSDTMLPVAVQEWAGLDNEDPTVILPPEMLAEHHLTSEDEKRDLTNVNDSGLADFNGIADLIEEQL